MGEEILGLTVAKWGLTVEEFREIAKSIDKRKDINHPTKPKAEGGDFFTIVKEGLELMRKDENFMRMFKTDESE